MRFSSKVDGLMIPVMVVGAAGALAGLVVVMMTPAPWLVRISIVTILVLVLFLLFSVMRSTYYVVEQEELRIVSGPFRWRIPVADITGIEPTRNPMSSPALSMDRLKVSYGKRKFVFVSPEDKDGFMRALQAGRTRQ